MMKFLYNLATDRSRGFIPSVLKVVLVFFAFLYGLAVRILLIWSALTRKKLGVKVVSVGNITMGGTGKTVVVEYAARFLRGMGRKCAIVSRGYGRDRRDKASLGDEPTMLKKHLRDIPVLVDPDRLRAACKARNEFACDTIILDDGFQQWKIKKDFEIVVIDASNPFGNGSLIPRGVLREPLSSLKRADVFILTKIEDAEGLAGLSECLQLLNRRALIVESVHAPVGFYDFNKPDGFEPSGILEGKTAGIFSGIAEPLSFERTVCKLKVQVNFSRCFPDHHTYTPDELDGLCKEAAERKIGVLITTEKDAVRLEGVRFNNHGVHIWVLCIELKILKNEEEFNRGLRGIYVI